MGAIRRISRTAKRLTRRVAQSDGSSPRTRSINLADASNVAVSTNAGESGSVQATSTSQRVRVRHNGDESYEESETTETRV